MEIQSLKAAVLSFCDCIFVDRLPTAVAVRAELAGSQATCENASARLHLTIWLRLNGLSVH